MIIVRNLKHPIRSLAATVDLREVEEMTFGRVQERPSCEDTFGELLQKAVGVSHAQAFVRVLLFAAGLRFQTFRPYCMVLVAAHVWYPLCLHPCITINVAAALWPLYDHHQHG